MVAVIVIEQYFFFVHMFPMGMVKIIVATMKRRNIQIGGIQKVQILKKLIFVSIFRAINAFVPFISTNLKLK